MIETQLPAQIHSKGKQRVKRSGKYSHTFYHFCPFLLIFDGRKMLHFLQTCQCLHGSAFHAANYPYPGSENRTSSATITSWWEFCCLLSLTVTVSKEGLGCSHLLLVGKEWKIRSTLGPPGITGLGKRNIAAIFWRLGWGGVKINSSLGPRAGFPLVFDGHWACIATITTERRPSFLAPTFSHCKAWAKKKKKKVFYLEFYWSDPISGSGLVSFATPSVGHKIAIVNLGESLKCIVQGSISLGNQPTFFPPFRVCLLMAVVIPRVL